MRGHVRRAACDTAVQVRRRRLTHHLHCCVVVRQLEWLSSYRLHSKLDKSRRVKLDSGVFVSWLALTSRCKCQCYCTVTVQRAPIAGIALQVGKLDADIDFSKDKARARVNHLPAPFQEMPFWLNFWINDLNSVIDGACLLSSLRVCSVDACITLRARPLRKRCADRSAVVSWGISRCSCAVHACLDFVACSPRSLLAWAELSAFLQRTSGSLRARRAWR